MNPRPLVILWAEANALNISLLENLLANFCEVKIFSKNKDQWQEKLTHISQSNFFSIEGPENWDSQYPADYIIFDNTLLAKSDSEIRRALAQSAENHPKILFLLPFSVDTDAGWQRLSNLRSFLLNENLGVGIIYVGDVLGPRMSLEEGLLGYFFRAALNKKVIKIPKENFVLYPVSVRDTAKEIIRSLFSFGPYGEEISLISSGIPIQDFLYRLKKFYPTLNYSFSENSFIRRSQEIKNKVILSINLEKSLKDTSSWFSEHGRVSEVVTVRERPRFKRINFRKERLINFSGKRLFVPIFIAILIFLSPYFLVFASSGLLGISIKEAERGKLAISQKLLGVSYASSSLSSLAFVQFSQVPVLGGFFSYGTHLSALVNRGAAVGLKVVGISTKSKELLSDIVGDEVYDPSPISESLALDLDSIYRDLSFFQGEFDSLPGLTAKIFKAFITEEKLSQAREKILQARTIAARLPDVLGKDKPKTYLVLFQNNMELRPTGGFIGSFALATFDGGRLVDINVQDVYSADGQLKGHVEPPMPIKNYLGEAGWYLRDSNWDPDFPTSAQRAEWFLDKEIDKSVDGVFAFDMDFVKGLLGVLGPVNLADFGMTINANNFYEKTQYEVESNFFPGSRKKSSFLTALVRELMGRISKISSKDYVPIANEALKELEERHIQVFLHDTAFQKAISNLGFDGAVAIPTCSGNCLADWLGLAEANLGVNKANYFLKRSYLLNSSFTNGTIKRKLEITYENNGSLSLGLAARYKGYVRVMVPILSQVEKVKIVSQQESFEIDPDIEDVHGRKEIGVVVEISPGQTKSVSFVWASPSSLDFTQKGEYRLYLRKQAGTEEDQTSIELDMPAGIKLNSNPKFFLTKEGTYVYNTNLTRDLFSRIYW